MAAFNFKHNKLYIHFCLLNFACMTGSLYANDTTMETVVITATKEKKLLSEVPMTVTEFDASQVDSIRPSHPSELLNGAAGVYVNNLGGEGHMTAIRQPISTSAVYLFLEDGIPTRPSGFFNHNGLYEVNIPQAERIEVVKGPGSALYGSEAVGGIINSFTAKPPTETSAEINLEAGGHGWRRGLISSGTQLDGSTLGVRADINFTTSNGVREASDYDRQSFTTRMDYGFDNIKTKSVITYSEIDQSGTSSLSAEDYFADSDHNDFHGDVGFRKVDALRFSSEFSWNLNTKQLLTVTPFYRKNTMDMMPSWMVSYDPNVRTTEFESFGLLSKYRYQFSDQVQMIFGVDVDHTPSDYLEHQVRVDFDDASDRYTGFELTDRVNYDFSATQRSVSPYIHSEFKVTDALLVTLGLRHDYFSVDYDDNLSADVAEIAPVETARGVRPSAYYRPDSQKVSYEATSPKLGVVFELNNFSHVYGSFNQTFRAPSVSRLFRSGASVDTEKLKPVDADSYEVGYRVNSKRSSFALAVYDLTKRNDIISVSDNNTRKTFNAGKTSHQGVEVEFAYKLTNQVAFALALSRAEHEYVDFSYLSRGNTVNVSGNDIGKAPKNLGNLKLNYKPIWLDKSQWQFEVLHVGKYFTDETNRFTYNGHNLANLRFNYLVNAEFSIYARVMNIADKRYSSYTSTAVLGDEIDYRPGMRRTLFSGFDLSF